MKFIKKLYKKIDAITAVLLLFILFLLLLVAYLSKLDTNIKLYGVYHEKMIQLELIDSRFDNFLLQKSSFVNFDEINNHVNTFENNLLFLNNKSSYLRFNKRYKTFLKAVSSAFEKKREALEISKSQNASLLNSIHYLFDLNSAISNNTNYEENIVDLVNDTLLLLMKFYINSYIDIRGLERNLSTIESASQQKHSVELSMFALHVRRNIGHIETLISIDKVVTEANLADTLTQLHLFLDTNYRKNIDIEKSITRVLLVSAFMILLILLFMHRRAIKTKDELFAFKTAVENSDNSVVITDANRNITYVNDIFERETGYTKEEAMGQNPRILKSDEAPQSFYDNLHETLARGQKWEGEFINKRKDGSLYYEKASISPIFIDGELVSYLAIKLNITEYIKKQREVKYLAYHDTLTSLPNRINLEEYLTQRLFVSQRSGARVALLFIDLDRFKIINDTLGHDVGDGLLVQCAQRMKQALRESDMLARVGGDEFVVVIEPVDDDYAIAQVAQKILELFHTPIETNGHHLNITLSIGIAISPEDGDDYKTLFKHADVAMYQAKSNGKNTYAFYKKELSVDVHNRLNLEQSLKHSLRDDEIYVVYQPKYDLVTQKVVGLEALARWQSNKLGLVTPDLFIPVAEEMGFILEMGAYIFKNACQDFMEFKKVSSSCKIIAINVSPVQLYQEDIMERFTAIAHEVGIATKHIVLEITEGQVMKNVEQGIKILNRLKAAGFGISIDDFGTGHSSMSYLKRFPIDELKIDKSFVDDLPGSHSDASIAKAIITLSKGIGCVTIAEGIENAEQEAFLAKNGCELGQGYYFCKPQTKATILKFLKENAV
jgi:diguanylate cyclase (GGDEF)-like protein/PAS domain S-box-containing protein